MMELSVTSIIKLFVAVVLVFGIGIFLGTYGEVLFLEMRHAAIPFSTQKTVVSPEEYDRVVHKSNASMIVPVDFAFGIVIPRLNANAKVTPNVDPLESDLLEEALEKGLAHAWGSEIPGNLGNVFIISHLSDDPLAPPKYNSEFYLLHKLEIEDEIYLTFKGRLYGYGVTGKRLVDANEVEYLDRGTSEKTLTIMTSWPPGLNFKRLLIDAEIISEE